MDSRAREVLKMGDTLFSDKKVVDTLWQALAVNFYPERANFTTWRSPGDDYYSHLASSIPPLMRREFANFLSSGFRPAYQKYVSIHVENETLDNDDQVRAFLDLLRDILWRGAYDPKARFVRATKETDHDVATFGNGVIYGSPNMARDAPLLKNVHLRDNVWTENADGEIDVDHRNWSPTARQLRERFGDAVSSDVKKCYEKEPDKTFECRHVVLPERLYHYKSEKGRTFPFVSLYVERDSETVLEEVGVKYFPYVIPRWQTVSDSVFGLSMAASIALPDSRTIQAVVDTLREAGEKFVDPPLIAVADQIRGDIPVYAGGIVTIESDYDEKTGEVLRPLTQDKGGMPIGFEIADALRNDLRQAWFLNQIQLPQPEREMTAFEFNQHMQQMIRSQVPVFEPFEHEYNAPLFELLFNIMKEHGAFPWDQMPDKLKGKEFKFKFKTPMSEMADRAEAQTFVEGLTMAGQVAGGTGQPEQLENINVTKGLRDSLKKIGFRQEWMGPEEAVTQAGNKRKQAMSMAQGAEIADTAAGAAEKGSKAAQLLTQEQ